MFNDSSILKSKSCLANFKKLTPDYLRQTQVLDNNKEVELAESFIVDGGSNRAKDCYTRYIHNILNKNQISDFNAMLFSLTIQTYMY